MTAAGATAEWARRGREARWTGSRARGRAEREAQRIMQADKPPSVRAEPPPSVDEVVDELRQRIEIEGARLSYRQNIASMQRVHISPAIGNRPRRQVTHRDIERLGRAMVAGGAAPSTMLPG
jgi:hypothetical protein